MQRRNWMLAIGCLIICGCGGGAPPTSFSDEARPLAEAMRTAINSKNTSTVEKIVTKAQERVENKSVSEREVQVLKQCQEYANDDDWESAKELIDASLSFK